MKKNEKLLFLKAEIWDFDLDERGLMLKDIITVIDLEERINEKLNEIKKDARNITLREATEQEIQKSDRSHVVL